MKKKWCRKGCIILGWLLVWQVISMLVGNDLLLVGPLETFRALIVHGVEADFWLACCYSSLVWDPTPNQFALQISLGIGTSVISGHARIYDVTFVGTGVPDSPPKGSLRGQGGALQ